MQLAQERRCGEALQAIIQLTTAEFARVGQGFSEDVEQSCERLDGLCNRLSSTGEAAAATAARCAGAGEKAVEAVATSFREVSSRHSVCHEQAGQARRALESSTIKVAEQLMLAETASIAAAKTGRQVVICDAEKDDMSWKENQGIISGKQMIQKRPSSEAVGQNHHRAVLGEVN